MFDRFIIDDGLHLLKINADEAAEQEACGESHCRCDCTSGYGFHPCGCDCPHSEDCDCEDCLDMALYKAAMIGDGPLPG